MPDGSGYELGYEVSILAMPKDLPHWDLVHSYLQLRRDVFMERMSWELHAHDGVEFEQYDTVDTVYVVAHRGRRAIGGARLRRTDCVLGTGRFRYSYMIRDACLGLLPQLPEDLCFDPPPVDADVWELTRLAAVGDPSISKAVLDAANDYLHGRGASRCLFLGPPAFLRMARSLGWKPEALGPLLGNKDGRFIAFQCAVRESTRR